MPSCNWAFGCAIGLFVITLVIILVILLGGTDSGSEKIVVMPVPSPAPAPSGPSSKLLAATSPTKTTSSSRAVSIRANIQELASAKEAAKLLKSGKPALVLFYADFCGHCKQMMPDFEQAAREASEKSGVIVAKVESGKLKDMASVSKDLPAISGFPTMCTNYEGGEPKIKAHVGRKDKAAIERLFYARLTTATNKGSLLSYARNVGSLAHVNTVRAASARQMVEYASLDEACAALKGKGKAIVMAYADWCGFCKAMKADYESLVEKAPAGVTVGRLNASAIKPGASCAGVEEIKAYPTILYNNGSKIIKVMGRQQLSALLDLLKK